MDLKTQTDAELISLRDNLNEWCLKHHQSKWGHRLWILVVILGVVAFLDGITDIFFIGINLPDILLVALGTITCFSWYKGDKRRKVNTRLLAEINGEIGQRDSITVIENSTTKGTESA